MMFLDTHVVVWLYQKDRLRFSSLALQLLDSTELRLSPVVALELEYLFEIGRLSERSQPILHFLERNIQLKIDDCSLQTLVAGALDAKWTRDPFDRLITCHAELRNAPLLTKDETILAHYRHARW
ncbi:MAG: hypothetical protein A2087_06130 [Spirochaetes bacterium GWD1_61_31]|nr:MAG: hypothetical protein A2087_06130 [Spirochaetes bacterium GWD1_61_31]OHD44698.1 MAG: hypothetical protein A2Y35_01110 [Spirochaetes bacterium GWE1_60_18]HAP43371.1 transposase [Spirochaetaceae bacterium]HAW86897.1 transposase [Spirochaetaceae bacterium]HAX37168.1 transposase [Spirochaetaceae bacterium]